MLNEAQSGDQSAATRQLPRVSETHRTRTAAPAALHRTGQDSRPVKRSEKNIVH